MLLEDILDLNRQIDDAHVVVENGQNIFLML